MHPDQRLWWQSPILISVSSFAVTVHVHMQERFVLQRVCLRDLEIETLFEQSSRLVIHS